METRTYNKDQAVESLQRLAMNWIAADQKRTKTSLARAAEISESCVRRLLNDGILPSNENLFKLAAVLNPKTKSTAKNEIDSPNIEFTLPYLAFQENNDIIPWTELASKLDSQVKKMIFAKASTAGFSVDELKADFGQLGINSAHELIREGLMNLENEVFSVRAEVQNVFFDSYSTKEIMTLSADMYYKPACNINYSMLVFEGVSKEGYAKVMDILEDAHQRVTEVTKGHKGAIPLIVTGFMDSMTTESVFGEGVSHE